MLLVLLLVGVVVGRNDYRDARKQRNLILDHGLDGRLVAAAKGARVSVNEFVVRLIEEAVGYAGDDCGRGDCSGVEASGGGAGAGGGRGGGGDFVGVSAQGGSVNWNAVLEAGLRAKRSQPVLLEVVEPDPLDVIA